MIRSEFSLIDAIKKRVSGTFGDRSNISGIGDDCAIYEISKGRFGLFSADMSIEDVHFDLRYMSLHDAGYRSMTSNISDIRAMCGTPVLALVSIGVPAAFSENMVLQLYDGIISCAQRNNTYIAGGDTTSSEKLIISISIYGESAAPVSRKGASPGDKIYLTGSTGMSLLGLELLQSGKDKGDFADSINRHLRPEPYRDIESIVNNYRPSSMIDISDGLVSDLAHITEMSRCGFEIYEERIPVPDDIRSYCSLNSLDVSDYTLYSGEEYELIFTSGKVIDNSPLAVCIGEITEKGKVFVSGGVKTAIEAKGFDHFRKQENTK